MAGRSLLFWSRSFDCKHWEITWLVAGWPDVGETCQLGQSGWRDEVAGDRSTCIVMWSSKGNQQYSIEKLNDSVITTILRVPVDDLWKDINIEISQLICSSE